MTRRTHGSHLLLRDTRPGIVLSPDAVFRVTIKTFRHRLSTCLKGMNRARELLALFGMTDVTVFDRETAHRMGKGGGIEVAIDAGYTVHSMNVDLPILGIDIERTDPTAREGLFQGRVLMTHQALVICNGVSIQRRVRKSQSQKKNAEVCQNDVMSDWDQDDSILALVVFYLSCVYPFYLLCEGRYNFKKVTDDAVRGHFKNWGIGIFIDGHNVF